MSAKTKGFLLFLAFLFIHSAVFTQEPILVSYQRNFLRANLGSKVDILRDAATDRRAAEFIGELYEFALDFVLYNAEILRGDQDFIILTITASRGLGTSRRSAAADKLWMVFSRFQDSAIKVEALNALAAGAGVGNTQVVENLNQFLLSQSALIRSGAQLDYPTVSACIAALAALGSSSSFPALFSVMPSGFPDSIVQESASALESIQGDYQSFLIDVIRRNPPAEKLAAYRAGAYNRKFSDQQRAELAQIALEVGLDFQDWETAASEMRYASVRLLGELRWTRATGLALKHFYRVQQDFNNGTASRERFLEAIACLGAMGSSEGAQALALQLGLLNSRMERNGEFDDAVTLGAVEALGEIGDKLAFDYLLYIGYLPYPEQIQIAAKEALSRLKW
jgi:hypothetical protein